MEKKCPKNDKVDALKSSEQYSSYTESAKAGFSPWIFDGILRSRNSHKELKLVLPILALIYTLI